MRQGTREVYEQRLGLAVRHIADHLDEPPSLVELAGLAGFSSFHFHRLFAGLVGETPVEMGRRLLLERACWQLQNTDLPVTEIAVEAGFETHEGFIRALRSAKGMTPTAYRQNEDKDWRLPTSTGVHFGYLPQLRFVSFGESTMDAQIKEMPARRAYAMAHKGAYNTIGQTFCQLWSWIQANNVPVRGCIGIWYDDPLITPVEELRSDAAVFVPEDFVCDDPAVHLVEIPAATYAVAIHKGPYDGLGTSWSQFIGQWLPASGYEIGPGICYELYVSDMSTTAPADLITELYEPVQPLAAPVV